MQVSKFVEEDASRDATPNDEVGLLGGEVTREREQAK